MVMFMKKKINILFLIIILFSGIFGFTYAFFIETKDFENDFLVGNFNVVLEENFEVNGFFNGNETLAKEVFVVNKETTGAIVRITYDEYMEPSTGSYYGIIFSNNCSDSIDGLCVTKNWTSSFLNDWVEYKGWYYYKKVLKPSESIQVLESITNNISAIRTYYLDFDIEAVQADAKAVKELWKKNVVVASDGTLTWDFS